jgi:hypothetical protein
MLEDVSLALADWADLEGDSFCALFSLDPGRQWFALCRARYLGRADLGTVAVANVVIVPVGAMQVMGFRVHDLLPNLPSPSDASFGAEPLAVHLPPPLKATSLTPPFGLEWRDHVIEAPRPYAEAILVQALDSVSPTVQMARIDGWATSGALRASGGFDPLRAFRLVVRDPNEPLGALPKNIRVIKSVDGKLPDETWRDVVTAPLAARAVTLISTVAQALAGVKQPRWRPDLVAHPLESVVASAFVEAGAGATLEDLSSLLWRCVEKAAQNAEMYEGFASGAAKAFATLIEAATVEAQAVAYFGNVLAGSTRHAPHGDVVARLLLKMLALEGRLALLDERALQAALAAGLIDRLARRGREHLLNELTADQQVIVLADCIQRAELSPSARILSARLIRQIASRNDRRADNALAYLLGLEPNDHDTIMATPSVADVAVRLSSLKRADYAMRVLRPVVVGEASTDRAGLIQALNASLRLVGGTA